MATSKQFRFYPNICLAGNLAEGRITNFNYYRRISSRSLPERKCACGAHVSSHQSSHLNTSSLHSVSCHSFISTLWYNKWARDHATSRRYFSLRIGIIDSKITISMRLGKCKYWQINLSVFSHNYLHNTRLAADLPCIVGFFCELRIEFNIKIYHR